MTPNPLLFENDVKIYGIQTELTAVAAPSAFENDVKIYGIQTIAVALRLC